MKRFDVIDLHEDALKASIGVKADTPVGVVATALGLNGVRSGSARKLCARVYWTVPDQPKNMVRLYTDQGGKGAKAPLMPAVG